MTTRARLVTRIALLSALIYVLSWATSYLPNVNLAFFIAFMAGFLWGIQAGIPVGAVGMGLWTGFNPFGPALLPVAAAQIAGLALCGLLGALFQPVLIGPVGKGRPVPALLLAALLCTLAFYIPVLLADAWVLQPFWPRFLGGLPFAAISLAANLIIFPLLFHATRRITEREGVR
jgi:hypothetical protein